MGLDNAVGEWITFVDADDWIDKNMYYKMYNKAISSQADIVLCDFYEYYSLDYKLLKKLFLRMLLKITSFEKLYCLLRLYGIC